MCQSRNGTRDRERSARASPPAAGAADWSGEGCAVIRAKIPDGRRARNRKRGLAPSNAAGDGSCGSGFSRGAAPPPASGATRRPGGRSEEHTSELQSLMRISYAVFFLQKKKHTEKQH